MSAQKISLSARAAIRMIQVYKRFFSPDSGAYARPYRRVCVFYPTCSEYAVLALEKYGFLKGFGKSLVRILKCHPWQREHIDIP
ncbi:MAG: membrane protein insertion efficiency factor YidD [Patescibacteria group bacterium]